MIRAILACDEEWGIGKNGGLPWPHNSADLKWFKKHTLGGVVAMGKTTWDSLPNKPLPGRNNVVVTSSKKDKSGPYHFLTFEQSVYHLSSMNLIQDVWIIGGAQLVNSLLHVTEEIWLSRISGVYNCDTFLPRDLIETNFKIYSSEFEDSVYVDKWKKL